MDRLRTYMTDAGLLWLRVLFGLGLMTHGWPKVFGGRMAGFTEGVAEMGFPQPAVFAWAAALSELLGGLLLVLGLGTRFAAVCAFITMAVAAFIRHADDPLSRKELALAYWAATLAIALLGPGRVALDHLIAGWRRRRRGQ